MTYLDNICLLARYQWIVELYRAAENNEPLAYFTAAVCATCVLIVAASLVRGQNRCWEETGVAKSLFQRVSEAGLAIFLPLYVLYQIGWRLLG